MKKIIFFALMMLLAAGLVYAKDYSAVKKAGPYQVSLMMAQDPVPVAENKATIEVEDAMGGYAEGAMVEVYLFMPSMPAMNYTIPAKPMGKKYEAVIKPTMPGGWQADIKVRDSKGNEHKAAFTFTAK